MQAVRRGFFALLWPVSAALLLLAGWCSMRLSFADRLARGSAPEVLRAIRLAPGDAQYYALWARLYDQPGRNPGEVEWALQKALSLDPRMSSAWIDLGLRSETKGDFHTAESYLLTAARVDRMWRPRWTLANYYYRRGDTAKLLGWTHNALEIADVRFLNPDPLFQLCWSACEDPARIWQQALPDRGAVHARYAAFLLDYCDSLLQAEDVHRALSVWNELCSRRFVPYPELDPARGASLTNGNFSAEPLSRGFDWRIPAVPGVAVTRSTEGLKLEFDGDQPESCDVLLQILPVLASHQYKLRFRYRTDRVPVKSGLEWQIGGGRGQVAGGSSEGSVSFVSAPSDHAATLKLTYHRPPGSMRFAGSILISGLELLSGE